MRRRRARVTTGAIALSGAIAVWWVSTSVFPYHSLNHDEAVYLQQAAMLLEGQLYLRPPVEDVLRPWFFVADGGRLYPKYTPVPAAAFALGKLLGGYRLALAGIAAGNLLLVTLVVEEVFDRRTGHLAAAFVLASPLFLIDSSVFLPYAPTTLLNLAFAYGYLRAARTDDRRWAAFAGGAAGLAFFARPYTAVLFAAPFVVHALWTLDRERGAAVHRLAVTAATGSLGVVVALLYNAVMTGSPWVFPYQAFAPLDGLGFGTRAILAHEVQYTPTLAVRANARVADLLFTEWVAGGLVGTALAGVGLLVTARQGASARSAALAGLFVSILAGNVYFWGNLNILGDPDVVGDGLVAVLGPYYHFDLLLPTAAFAARGALEATDALRAATRERLPSGAARAVAASVLLVAAGASGAVTAQDLDRRVGTNLETTRVYETAYRPFDGGPPSEAVVLLPTPYGDWLNHPFQPLRNDPGFDGPVLYAMDHRPFDVVDAFPDRRLYRYGYRGPWAPYAGSPSAARLDRVRRVSGSTVRLGTTVGVPEGTAGLTVWVATDRGTAYYVADTVPEALDLVVSVTSGRARVDGNVRPVGNDTVEVAGRDTVRLGVFVDYGGGDGFTYRFDLPVDVSAERVRALSPRVERCRSPRRCGGEAAHVPATAPDGVFVRTSLVAGNTTHKFRST